MKTCPVCQKPFKPTTKRQICCSVACGKSRRESLSPTPTTKSLDEVHTQTDSEWTIHLPKTRIHTLEQLIDHCQVDLNKWKIKHFKCNKWEVGTKNPNSTVTITPLFQVSAVFIPNVEGRTALTAAEIFKDLVSSHRPKPTKIKRAPITDPHMLELGMYDLHLGKLAWHAETGWSDYDSKITTQLVNNMVDIILGRVAHFQFDKILFPIGHDFFQVDNPSNTTFRGTPVDVDSRFKRTYRAGLDMLIQVIERLRQIAPVDVVMVPGNHDFFSNFTLGVALECFFKDYPDVQIDNSPTVRKYYRYGNTLLGLTHGNDIKPQDLLTLMPTEAPADFAASLWREWHLGHLHKDALTEKHGIRTRILPSLCSADAWHAMKGFVGNLRLAEAFVWHPVQCLVTQVYYYQPEPR